MEGSGRTSMGTAEKIYRVLTSHKDDPDGTKLKHWTMERSADNPTTES